MTTHTILSLGLFDLNYGRYQQDPATFNQHNEKTASSARRARQRARLATRHFGYPD